jgi:bacillithiol biosynthesis cysteine-adding enzyme BshC
MPGPTIHTAKVLGRQRLYLDVLYDPDRTGRFFTWPHPTPAAFEACARRVCRPPIDRKAAAALLVRQNEAYGAPPAAIAAAQSLAEPNAVCVFTGQQAGLLGGPLYTIYKAVTVLNWTRRLRDLLKRPVVPVFWNASDDHDFEEIRWTALPNLQNQAQRLTLDIPGLPPRMPASQIVLGDGIHDLLEQLWAAQMETEFTPAVRAAVEDCYRPEHTFARAFGRFMARLFGEHGLVIFDPADPEAKAFCAPLFAEELAGHALTASSLAEIGQRLEESGYHRQVEHPDGHTHLFHIENGRHAIHATNGKLWTDPEGTPHPPEVWLERLRNDPAAFSSGVLLRPVAQSYMFPVVAVVCGPSEIAYWAQSRALFDRFSQVMPVVLPRMSATIIERKIQSAVEALGHDVSEFFGDIEQLINTHFEQSFPADLESRFDAEKRDSLERLARLKEIVTAFEPTLDRTFEVDAGKIAAAWSHLEDKVFQAHKRKGDEIRARFYKLAAHLRPEGRPQERIFGIVYYVNKYGFSFIERIIAQLPVGAPDHRLIAP